MRSGGGQAFSFFSRCECARPYFQTYYLREGEAIKTFHLMYRPDHLLNLYNQYGKALGVGGDSVVAGYLVGEADANVEMRTTAERCLFFEFNSSRLKGTRLSVIISLWSVCRRERFDAVICHRYKPFMMMAVASIFLPPLKLFAVVHANGQFSRFGRRLLAFVFRRRITYIAVSEAVRQDILSNLWRQSPESVVTLPNVIDIEKHISEHVAKDVARKRLGIAADAFVVGTVGRLVEVKAQGDLLRAFALCRDRMPGAKLIIIGGGTLERSLKQLAEDLRIGDDVLFAGEIGNASRLLKAYDIFVLPSLREGQGLVLLEAMAAGLPIVVSDIPGVAEAVGPWTIRVPPQTPRRLADALLTLHRLGAEERNRLGQQGLEHLLGTFDQGRFQRRLRSFLTS